MSPLQDDAFHSIYTIALLMKTPRRTFLQSILALFIGRKCVEAGVVKPLSFTMDHDKLIGEIVRRTPASAMRRLIDAPMSMMDEEGRRALYRSIVEGQAGKKLADRIFPPA